MNSVQFENVNVHYSLLSFRQNSLKAYVFDLLGFKKKRALPSVHALKDINLQIKAGERVALIGQNGAGKTTLLKTIAGLYPLSSGKRAISGKVRALFELSLGFEYEATGRENILYRGLLLGQKPKQMKSYINEIIAFADIGKFIDYPIKSYSTGMLVRLAFAISTTIPGQLLLLDEILGAGDANFSERSRERIAKLINNAEILILASHDLNSVRRLCNRGIHLRQGRILYDGNVEDAINDYMSTVKKGMSHDKSDVVS